MLASERTACSVWRQHSYRHVCIEYVYLRAQSGDCYLQEVPNKVASELKSWYGWHGAVKHRNRDWRGGVGDWRKWGGGGLGGGT